MHRSAMEYGRLFFETYAQLPEQLRVLDIGAQDVNGSLKEVCPTRLHYCGVDFVAGKGVDVVLTDPYHLPFENDSVDIIVCSSCFEHSEFFWLLYLEMIRILKPTGVLYVNAPSNGYFHRYPVDCWRFYPDSGRALVAWAERNGYSPALLESFIGSNIGTPGEGREWNDFVAVFVKDAGHAALFQNRILSQIEGYQNGWVLGASEFLNYSIFTHYQLAAAQKNDEIETQKITFAEGRLQLQEWEQKGQLLNQTIADQKALIKQCQCAVAERDGKISNLTMAIAQWQQTVAEKDGAIKRLTNEIEQLQRAVSEQNTTVKSLIDEVRRREQLALGLEGELSELRLQFQKLIQSRSWRFTSPLRLTGFLVRGQWSVALAPLARNRWVKTTGIFARRVKKYLAYMAKGDLKGLCEYSVVRSRSALLSGSSQSQPQAQMQVQIQAKKWGILTPGHTLFVAQLIAERLTAHGWTVEIMTSCPEVCAQDLYIVICPQIFDRLPSGEKRILFQMEQSVSSRWFTDRYCQLLENTLAVLEYSRVNLDFLAAKGIRYPHVYYLPIGASDTYGANVVADPKKYDVIFYGDSLSSPRRRYMLEALKQQFNVQIVNEVFGDKMIQALKEARVVVNIHYYENALLEMPRIQECLSLGLPVVSEVAQDQSDYPELGDAVIFFEEGSIEGMIAAVDQALKMADTAILASVAASKQRFHFMFDRFLVAMNQLPASYGKNITITFPEHVDTFGLSLPETIDRRRIFEATKPSNCVVFDGMRRRPGWVGCGLSYAVLAHNALQHGMKRITVMEDDVILPSDYQESLAIITAYLDKEEGAWDVFCGLIADLHPDTQVLSVEQYAGRTFVTIDKMTSMVFNIYSKNVLECFCQWDPDNANVDNNTIDRYLENQKGIRVIVTLPYFVGHREEAFSTLWGFQNDQYKQMIANSEAALQLKVDQFLLRQEGQTGLMLQLETITQETFDTSVESSVRYAEWIHLYDTITDSVRSDLMSRLDALPMKPLISVLMSTYNPKTECLIKAIESVRSQLYPHWELCIADDASTDLEVRAILKCYAAEDTRIKVVFHESNCYISAALNSALELVTGSWVAFLGQEDLLTEHALLWVADAINRQSNVAFIYSDEDRINEVGERSAPHFKCDWNIDLLCSQNFIAHLAVYQAALLREVGGLRVGFEGSQDHDLILRYCERLQSKQIHHIPRVLYHWRAHSNSTAQFTGRKPYPIVAGERAISEYFQRQGINVNVSHTGYGYRVQYALPASPPLVSLIIPTRNGLHLLRPCVEGILSKTTYPNYEIIIVDNGSDDPETLAYFKQLVNKPLVRVLRDDRPFNYSALNNTAVKLARGSVLGLLNNDLEVISADWLSEMVSIALQPGVGVVGAKLFYPDNTLQHAGVILGIGGVAGHVYCRLPGQYLGYFGRAHLLQGFSAVTGACLVVRKNIYEKVGGLNEEHLAIALNDIDFCLKVLEAGYRNVWTPYAELYHHESATRGPEDTPEKKARFEKEVHYFRERWRGLLQNDPAYNLNLSLNCTDFAFSLPPRMFGGEV